MAQARFSMGITASGNTETVVILGEGETAELPTALTSEPTSLALRV